MKKTFLLTASLLLSFTLLAQPKPNSFFAGGSFRFYTNSYKANDGGTSADYNRTGFIISPEAGYFLSDKFAVGAEIGGGIQTQKYPDSMFNVKQTQSQFSIAPFARYYFINQKFGLFGEGSMGITFGKTKNYSSGSPTNETQITNYSMGIYPGIYYSVSDHLMLESTIGWFGFSSVKYKYSNNSSETYNDFGLNLSTSDISLGFTWIF